MMEFKIRELTMFTLDDSNILITPDSEKPILVRKDDCDIETFDTFIEADKYIVGEYRGLEVILDSWWNVYTDQSLRDYLESFDGKGTKAETLGSVSAIEAGDTENFVKALYVIFNEMNRPKEIHIDALNKIDAKVAKLLDVGISKNTCTPIDSEYSWNVTTSESESFENQVYGYDVGSLTEKIKTKKALLLIGVPGTGKTRIMLSLLNQLTNWDTTKYKIISFGQSTDYVDFIGGITSVNGEWQYVDGILTKMCKTADSDRSNNYYLGIDELSRGNTEAIFGELMTGIEHRDTLITLQSGRTLVIPSNLYIIGTMNILDNSTKKLDAATLERFNREIVMPQWNTGYIKWLAAGKSVTTEVLEMLEKVSISMSNINNLIAADELLDADKVIGVRAISGIELTADNIKDAVKNQLIPDVKKRIKFVKESSNYTRFVRDLEEIIK